jgi:hypothetical protein
MTSKDRVKKNNTYVTSHIKRSRRTRADVANLDEALYSIVMEQQPMTVRQVFYQAVVRGLVPKDEGKGYNVIQRRLVEMRRADRLPWYWITDNARTIYGYERYSGPRAFQAEIASLYRRDYWRNLSIRCEIWIEKDALSGVVRPITDEYGLDLYVSRGFASVSYLKQAADTATLYKKPTYVYIMSDFDPSGLALVNAIRRELPSMAPEVDWSINRIAVTPEQIDKMSLPTRALKNSDTRAKRFAETYGNISVELDAIPPQTLRALVETKIAQHMNPQTLQQMKDIEASEREALELFEIPQTDDDWGYHNE